MEIKNNLKRHLVGTVKGWRVAKASRYAAREEVAYGSKIRLEELTPDEKKAIDRKWGGVVPDLRIGYTTYAVFKTLDRFDPDYVAGAYYYPAMIQRFNPAEDAWTLQNKGMLCNFFREIPQPVLLLRNVNGTVWDASGRVVPFADAVRKLAAAECDMIIKPSVDSCCGTNVRVIRAGTARSDLERLLAFYDKDFVVQEFVEQSEATAAYNPSSLNTMRVGTLFLNGTFSVCCALLRCGTKGMIVDNLGAGGVMVGIENSGKLKEYGYSMDGTVHRSTNGVCFGEQTIPDFGRVIATALEAHRQIPTCAFAGWDLALAKDGRVLLVEANLTWPGVFGEQMCCGPIFGERTDEVIDFLKRPRKQSRLFY